MTTPIFDPAIFDPAIFHANPKISTLIRALDAPSDFELAHPRAVVSGGKLRTTLNPGLNSEYYAAEITSGWDLTESSISTRMDTTQFVVESGEAQFIVYDRNNFGNRIMIIANSSGALGFYKFDNGTGLGHSVSGLAKNIAFRVSMTGGVVKYSYSTDGTTWIDSPTTYTLAWSPINVSVSVNIGHWDSTKAAGSNEYVDTFGINTDLTIAAPPATPPSGNLLLSETWTGADGSAWSSIWVPGYTGTGAVANVQANAGQLSTGPAGNYAGSAQISRRLNTKHTNIDATIKVRVISSEVYPQIYLRGGSTMDGDSGYQFQIEAGGGMRWVKTVGYSETPYGTGLSADRFTLGSWYWIRLQAIGSSSVALKAKLWADGQAEPSTWRPDLSFTDASSPLVDGYFGFSVKTGAAAVAATVQFDSVTLYDGSALASVISWKGLGIARPWSGLGSATWIGL